MPPTKPLPTASDSLPDQSVTTEKLAPDAVTSDKQALEGSNIDQSASRLLDTVYQNTTGKLMQLCVIIEFNTPLNTDGAQVDLLVDIVTPPLLNFGTFGLPGGVASLDIKIPLTLIIPAGSYYEVRSAINGTGNLNIINWTESSL